MQAQTVITYDHNEKTVLSIEDPIYGLINFLSDESSPSELTFSQLLYKLFQSSSAVKRLEGVHQAGAAWLWAPNEWNVTRLQHSIGVMLLIRKLAPHDHAQQLAGLLHDISHSAFSHVIDLVLYNTNDDFHDTVVKSYVTAPNHKFKTVKCSEEDANLSLWNILEEFHMEQVANVLMEEDHSLKFTLLEMDFPLLCADRIDYTLRDQILYGFYKQIGLTRSDISNIVSAFTTFNKDGEDIIMFDVEHLEEAEKFMKLYKNLVVDYFLGLENMFMNDALAQLLRLSMQQHIISIDDMIWGDDDFILETVKGYLNQNSEKDALISDLFSIFKERRWSNELKPIEHYVKVVTSEEDYDYSPIRKKRFVDFLILGKDKQLENISKCSATALLLFTQMEGQDKQKLFLKRLVQHCEMK